MAAAKKREEEVAKWKTQSYVKLFFFNFFFLLRSRKQVAYVVHCTYISYLARYAAALEQNVSGLFFPPCLARPPRLSCRRRLSVSTYFLAFFHDQLSAYTETE